MRESLNFVTILKISSGEQSLTIINSKSKNVCDNMLFMHSSRKRPLNAGIPIEYLIQ